MTPEENQYSDIPYWLQRNWTTFSAQPYYGMGHEQIHLHGGGDRRACRLRR